MFNLQNVSATTSKLVITAINQGSQSESNMSQACQRAVRVAYSRDNMDEANFIIQKSPVGYRKHVVSFFKQCGVVVVENARELPRADRIADKAKQAKVFETLASKSFGISTIRDVATIIAMADKKAERAEVAKQKRDSLTIAERVIAQLQKAFGEAQKADDYELQTALGLIIAQYKKAK